MNEDILPRLSALNAKPALKTQGRNVPLRTNFSDVMKDREKVVKPHALTTKAAIEYLLEGTLKSKVCRYCLNVTPGLAELDQLMKIAGSGNLYKVTIRDIVASFHPFKVVDNPDFPNKICQKCVDRALASYLFTQQCERAERAMLNCFDDIYEKFDKLDPVDRPKKRGRQKLNPNYNILHAEYPQVIDYAEPIINIINIGAETSTKEPAINDFECKKCCQILPNLESLLNHEKLHPKTMWYNCRLCGKSFPKRNHLKKHHHRAHVVCKEVEPVIDKNFYCKECDHVTDNYVIHLQHVEKHKFRNVMEHLIEKRMDRLCVVCFNEGRLTDLDQMVCIHGGHPDLMGDKTLYTVLASTLPNPKAYKYQELYIPTNAQTMTISKRQASYDSPNAKKLKLNTYSACSKDQFTFSDPVVVSKDGIKTNHFYHFVLMDPEYQNAVQIDECINAKEFAKINAAKTKLVEIIQIEEIDNDMGKRKVKVAKKALNTNANAINNQTKTVRDLKQVQNTELAKAVGDCSTAQLTKAKNINRKDENTDNTINASEFTFLKPYNIKSKNELSEDTIKEKTEICDCGRLRSNCDIHLVVNKPTDGELMCKEQTKPTKEELFDFHEEKKKTECKYCWVFAKTNKCEHCKKANENYQEIAEKSQRPKYQIDAGNINKNAIKLKDTEIWQCKICLTNNNGDKFSCHCCGTLRITEYNEVKIKFSNKTFFDFKQPGVIEEKKEIDPPNIELEKTAQEIAITEVPSMMDCRPNSDDNNPTEIDNNMQEMDTETIITRDNEDLMDIEENPISLNRGLEWTNSILSQLNIVKVPSITRPTIGTNVQFNIGYAPQQKAVPRKLKKNLRNMKAFHK